MNAQNQKKYLAILALMGAVCLGTTQVAAAGRRVATRDLWIDFQAPHGTYFAILFRSGTTESVRISNDFTPSGGIRIKFLKIPTDQLYYVRFYLRDEKRQSKRTGDFFLPSNPFWPQQEGPFNWVNL